MQCTICNEAVTNPICVECIGKEMEAWLNETEPELISAVRDIKEWYKTIGPISKCILCGNTLSVCRHCFTKNVFDMVGQSNKNLEEEFIRQFSCELSGY